jgi:DNA-binding PadR family transcriptional regulator
MFPIIISTGAYINTALRPLKPLTRFELIVLSVLYTSKKGLSLRVLKAQIDSCSFNTTYRSLDRLKAKQYIISQRIGKRVFYSITPEGRVVLMRFADTLEKIVKQKLTDFEAS